MLRILLAALVLTIPTAAMAQSPWTSGAPTYVSRGAQLPAMNKTEYSTPAPLPAINFAPPSDTHVTPASVPATALMKGSTLFAVDYSTPISSQVFASEGSGTIISAQTPVIGPPMESNWDPLSGCFNSPNGCCNIPKCVWARYEQLFWNVGGGDLPPLVTTGPASAGVGAAGAVGTPGTRILFGGRDYMDDHRNGYRVSAGGWLTEDRVLGIEGSYFSLEGDSTAFTTNSLRFPVLTSSPFVNAATGRPERVLIAFPGVVSGSTTVNYEVQRLYGFDVMARVLLSNQICGRLDGLFGYRQINYSENLSIRRTLIPSPNGPIPVELGTTIRSNDTWETDMNYHGMVVGLNWEVCCSKFFVNVRPRVTLGQGENNVNRGGLTSIAVPGQPTERFPGGVYNLSSNFGQSSRRGWTVVPEADLQIGYNVCDQLRVFGGYSLMYLPQVARAGDQIDPIVNTDLVPPPLATNGPQLPGAFVNRSGMCIQGVSLGLEIRY